MCGMESSPAASVLMMYASGDVVAAVLSAESVEGTTGMDVAFVRIRAGGAAFDDGSGSDVVSGAGE